MLFLLACVDYEVKGDPPEPEGLDSAVDTDCPPSLPDCTDTDTTYPPDDTAPPDPDDCSVDATLAGLVAINEECQGTTTIREIVDPYDLQIEYSYTSSASGPVVKTSVINLTDDDGDGSVTTDDVPDIVFTVYQSGELVALHGDGSGEIFVSTGWAGAGDVVTADVDADGDVDICGFSASPQHIRCVDATGAEVWESTASSNNVYPHITACDLDQDGMPEVIGDTVVVSGADGSTLWEIPSAGAYTVPVCADIDLDGSAEVIYDDDVYESDGSLKWSIPAGGLTKMAAVVNADSDDEAEIFLAADQLYLYDSDGTQINATPIPTQYPGPPCAADFDGDGEVEVAVPAGTAFYMFDTDGTELWRAAMQDNSGLAGCSGYDMDGDQIYEVLFADEVAVRLYDGATGAVLYESYAHNSGTLYEYPVIADVDNDGSAEILIAENLGTRMGITVYGHNGDGWPASGPTWPAHDFAVSNFDQDGTIPTSPTPSWLEYNVFRARPAVDDPSYPDLAGDVVDVCVADCTNGPIKISIEVWNEGGADIEAGVPWALYKDDGGSLAFVMSGLLPEIAAGTSIASFEIELTPDQMGQNGFLVQLDDDGSIDTLTECDETNNGLRYTDTLCP